MGESFTDEVPSVYKFPDDILRCIFLLNASGGRYNAVKSTMSISQVCQRWRVAALQNRLVWLGFID